MLVKHLGTDIVFLSPWWGREEQTAFVHVPLMTGTGVSHSLGIPVSKDNPVSCVKASGNGNMSYALTD